MLEDGATAVEPSGHDRGSSRGQGLFAIAIGFLLPVAYSEATYHTFLAPKSALALVALVPGMVALLALTRRSSRAPIGVRRSARSASGFCVAAMLSAALADVPLLAVTGSANAGTGLLFVLLGTGCWAMGTQLRTERRRLLGTAIVAAGVLNAVVAWSQARGFAPAGLEMATAGPLTGRAFGLLGNPVHLGAICAGTLLLAGSRVRDSRRVAGWLAAAALVAGAVQLSGTRAALGLAGLALVAVLVRWWPGWPRAALLAFAVVAGLQLASAGTEVVDAGSRVQGEGSLDGVHTRAAVWGYGAAAAVERPLLGWGPGRFAAATTARYDADVTRHGVHTNAHSWPVEYATTTGAVGLGLLVGWLVLAGRQARGPLAWFAALHGVFALVEPTSLAITPVALLALGAAGPVWTRPKRPPALPQRVAVGGAAVGVAVGVVLLAGEVKMSDALLDTSLMAWRSADQLLPAWPEVTYLGARVEAFQALATAGPDHRERALALARETVARDPADPQWWAYLGYIELRWGSLEAAGEAFNEALDRLPSHPMGLLGAAEHAHERGDDGALDDACRRLAEVMDLLPDVCSGARPHPSARLAASMSGAGRPM